MICPDCNRVIQDHEICPCKKEAIHQKNLEIKRREAEERRQLEEERLAEEREAEERRKAMSESVERKRNAVVDSGSEVIKDSLEILSAPSFQIRRFADSEKTATASILSVIAIILNGFLTLGIMRSRLGLIVKSAGGTSSAFLSLLTGAFMGILFVGINLGGFYVITRGSASIKEIICLNSAKYVLYIPAFLFATFLSFLSPIISLSIALAAFIGGGAFDYIGLRSLGIKEKECLITMLATKTISLIVCLGIFKLLV